MRHVIDESQGKAPRRSRRRGPKWWRMWGQDLAIVLVVMAAITGVIVVKQKVERGPDVTISRCELLSSDNAAAIVQITNQGSKPADYHVQVSFVDVSTGRVLDHGIADVIFVRSGQTAYSGQPSGLVGGLVSPTALDCRIDSVTRTDHP